MYKEETMAKQIDLSRTQQYLEWLKTKLYLDSNAEKAKSRVVKRGEVYKCFLGQGIGSEECKERPCVIIQNDTANTKSPNVIVAPITHTGSRLNVVVPIEDQCDNNGEVILDGNVLLGNIVCISKARLGNCVGNLSPLEMGKVDKAIAISIDIKRHYDKLMNIHEDKLVYIDKLRAKVKTLEEENDSYKVRIRELEGIIQELECDNV
jgi:mRNA interferase MazF